MSTSVRSFQQRYHLPKTTSRMLNLTLPELSNMQLSRNSPSGLPCPELPELTTQQGILALSQSFPLRGDGGWWVGWGVESGMGACQLKAKHSSNLHY